MQGSSSILYSNYTKLPAIARLAMADSYTNPENARRIEKIQQKHMESIKSRQPDFLARIQIQSKMHEHYNRLKQHKRYI